MGCWVIRREQEREREVNFVSQIIFCCFCVLKDFTGDAAAVQVDLQGMRNLLLQQAPANPLHFLHFHIFPK